MLILLSIFLIACVALQTKVKELSRFALSGVVALQVLLLSSVIGIGTTAQAQNAGPQYPIIFVHGLGSSGATWETMIKGLDNVGYLTGGRLRAADSGPICYWRDDWKDDADPSAYLGAIPSAIPDYKRYFAIDFTDSFDLSFYEQARQLKVVIDCVKALTNTTKVSLVAHSMGGLASRFYLQSLAGGAAYGSDVQRLITIGTPHNGANALADLSLLLDGSHYLLPKVGSKDGGFGIAVHSLVLPYTTINLMNAQTAVAGHQLPPILYASIRYGSTFGLGDGIVSFKSQSLLESLPASVQGSISPSHTPWDFPTPDKSTLCYKKAISEVSIGLFSPVYHVCETSDPQSIASVAYALSTDVRSVVTEEPSGIGQTGFAATVSYQATGATSAFTVGFEWGLSATSFTEHEETTGYGSSYSSDIIRIERRVPGSTVYFRGYTIVNGIRANGNVRQVTLHVLPVPPQPLLAKPLLSLPASGANGLSERPVFKWSSVVNASSYRIFVSKTPIDPLAGC